MTRRRDSWIIMGLLTHPFPRVSSFKLKTPDSDSVLVSGSDSVRAASSRWNLWGKLFALPLCVHIHSVSLGSQLLGALRVNCTSRAVSLSLFLKEIIFKRNNLLRRRLGCYQNERG